MVHLITWLKTVLKREKMHGAIFDGAIFLGNIAFFSLLPRLGDDVAETTAGVLLLLAVLTQGAGAWWKKGFLGQRLASRRPLMPISLARGFLNVLLFLHFILFSMMTLFALALLGIYDMRDSGGFYRGDMWVLIALLVGGFTTNLVRLAGQPRESSARIRTKPGWLEYGADGLLWVSVSLVTRIFWDGLVNLVEPARGIGMNGHGILLLVAVSLLYTFFYLPGRYLFLVEDYRSVTTWLQVWAAMLPVAWMVVIG
jgi:hypothetical protein